MNAGFNLTTAADMDSESNRREARYRLSGCRSVEELATWARTYGEALARSDSADERDAEIDELTDEVNTLEESNGRLDAAIDAALTMLEEIEGDDVDKVIKHLSETLTRERS